MYKITSEQMKLVLAVIGKPHEEQMQVFLKLEFDPYIFVEDQVPDKYVLYREDVEEGVIDYCNDLSFFTDFEPDRITEIENGGQLTSEEHNTLSEIVCRDFSSDEPPWFVVPISDGNKTVYVSCCIYFMGQSGFDFARFFGFFLSSKESEEHMANRSDIIVY